MKIKILKHLKRYFNLLKKIIRLRRHLKAMAFPHTIALRYIFNAFAGLIVEKIPIIKPEMLDFRFYQKFLGFN